MLDLFEESRERLQVQIQTCIERRELIKVLHCLTAAKVPVTVIAEALENDASPSVSAHVLTQATADRLDLDGFRVSVEDNADAQRLLDRFPEAECIWLYLVNELFIHHDHNVAETNRFRNILQAKRTQSIKKSKWGEVDDSGWAKVLAEFAEEKLLGSTFEIALRGLPMELRVHLERANAFNLVPRFAWVIFETDKPAQDQSDTASDAASKSGVEYENELRYRIETEVPDAVVEMTPASGDQGADLIVYIRDLKFVIQAKYYSGNVGNSAVQEAYAAKGYYQAHFAIVVTNSEFTKSARDLAGELEVLLVYDMLITELLKAAAR